MIDTLQRPPTSSMAERDLVRGYSGQASPVGGRTESCACGGLVSVDDAGDHREVGAALLVHYRSTRHAQWAVAAGWR